jgi:predicted metal-dependent phosphoesterase TrpH
MPTVPEAIDVIHAAGGLAVWAHPFWDLDADPDVLDTIDRFAAAGLDGVETFYITHTEAQTRLIHEYCSARGLLTTGSADFHGPDHPRFHAFRAFETYDLGPDLGPLGM